MSEAAVQEKKKRSFPIAAIIAICLVVLILLAAGGYYYSYTRADAFASEGDLGSARQWLILPELTKKHDAELLDYLDARDMLAAGDYAAAAQAFAKLGNYKDSADAVPEAEYALAGEYMKAEDYAAAIELYSALGDFQQSGERLLEARFGLGLQMLEEDNDPAGAHDIFAQLEQEGYEGAGEARQEAVHCWAKLLMEQGELLKAHDKLGEIPDYPGVDQTMEELTELIYNAAVEAYRQDQPVDAVKYFLLITPYKNSEAYFPLIQLCSAVGESAMKLSSRGLMEYDEMFASMWENFDLEDTKDLMLSDSWIGCRFLQGNWKTEDGRYYFRMKLKDDGHFSANYTLPWFDENLEYRTFSIRDGIYFFELDDYVNKAQYQFTVIDQNTIEAYCYKDGETYTLYRQ